MRSNALSSANHNRKWKKKVSPLKSYLVKAVACHATTEMHRVVPHEDVSVQELVASSDQEFSWIDKDDIKGVPIGGIIGECSPVRRCMYVIRVFHAPYIIVGNYEEGNDYAEYEYYGSKRAFDWEYLVSTEEIAGRIALLIEMSMGRSSASAMELRLTCTN